MKTKTVAVIGISLDFHRSGENNCESPQCFMARISRRCGAFVPVFLANRKGGD